jgi:hypothetical protein
MATSSKKGKEALVEQPVAGKGARQETARKRREERMKAYERNRRQWMMTKIGAGIVGVLILAGIGFLVVEAVRDRELNRVPDGVREYSYAGNMHNNSVTTWTESPPVGGEHYDQWQKCGFYSAPINPGLAVHTLEHGAIWITYRPDLPQDQIDKLREMASEDAKLLVSPYEGLQAPIVATAWGRQLEIQDADARELKQFIRVFKDKPGIAPEAGGNCATGVDVPM